ncbi:LmbU family transcriptional regulator [Sphaerisporangium dianthi]|uniref:LmbU family transcriptional regulator n=1 Tax=Sphaerisporangium dianthi TaxID=1436120 RepID=A0ABV9CMM1_9ACTN
MSLRGPGTSVSAAPIRNSNETRNGRLPLDGSALTRRTSLSLPPRLSLNEWQRLGRQIFVISDSSAWWLGDWLIYGQATFPNRYKRAIAETSLDYQTLRNYAWVARRVTAARRRDKLSFQHHAEVASLPEDKQDEWLSQAEKHGWSRNELRKRIREDRNGGARAAAVSSIHVNVIEERRERWVLAARQADQDLLNWMLSVLDDAAQAVLESTDARPELPGGDESRRVEVVNGSIERVPA